MVLVHMILHENDWPVTLCPPMKLALKAMAKVCGQLVATCTRCSRVNKRNIVCSDPFVLGKPRTTEVASGKVCSGG
jgi:hypothetical protein